MRSAVLGFIFSLLALSAAGQITTAGLVGDWRMDGTGGMVPDISGMGNHGVLAGEAEFAQDPVAGPVLRIYGLSGHIEVPSAPMLEPARGTVEVWVSSDSHQNWYAVAKFTDRLLRSNADANVPVYGVRLRQSGRVVAFVADDNAESWGTFAPSHGSIMRKSPWHLLAVRWDGSTVALFVDGEAEDSEPYSPIPGPGLSYSGASPLCIGAPVDWRWGEIARVGRVRMYERALTEAELRANYQADLADFPGMKQAR